MITAKFYSDQNNVVRAFEFNGHAAYANKGFDIVCAAVSAIAQTVIGTLDELLARKVAYEINSDTGRISCEVKDLEQYTKTEQIAIGALMYSVLIGTQQLLPNYGAYLDVQELTY